jgi:acetyl esterase
MKWLKIVLIVIIMIIGGVVITNQLTPKPISLLVQKQFDTSKKATIYPRPKGFKKATSGMILKVNQKYSSKYDNNTMDIYIPKQHRANKNRALFWVHGGAYVGGDKRDTSDYLKMLCQDTGQIIININYTLATKNEHPAAVQQLNEAIKSVKDDYKDQIDWSNISIGGDSAGAQISSEYILALQDSKIRQRDKLVPSLKNSQVKRFISLSGLLEPQKFSHVEDRITSFMFSRCGWQYFGRKNFEQNQEIKQLALLKHAKTWNQKTFLTDGNTNTFTKQMKDTAQALNQNGGSVTMVDYPKTKAKLNHEYQFDFSNRQAKKTYQDLVSFFVNN